MQGLQALHFTIATYTCEELYPTFFKADSSTTHSRLAEKGQ